jgi:hypothetical protein
MKLTHGDCENFNPYNYGAPKKLKNCGLCLQTGRTGIPKDGLKCSNFHLQNKYKKAWGELIDYLFLINNPIISELIESKILEIKEDLSL